MAGKREKSGEDGHGAYGLFIVLRQSIPVVLAGRHRATVLPGLYLYAGSAWGPGGITARLARHRRQGKAVHWHVDRLTNVAGVAAAIVLPGGRECAIVEVLEGWPGVDAPLPGFGSSDCRRCSSHLLRLPDETDPNAVVARLIAGGLVGAALWRAPDQ